MNERIVKLFMQSVDSNYIPLPIEDHIPSWTEKFAELIVLECVQTLKDNTPVIDEHDSVEDWDRGYDRAMKDCVHHIQEHFGVEE